MKKYYIAYGSNMNVSQMKHRCPTAVLLGAGTLLGWQLEFRGLATISRAEGKTVPVVLWRIDEESEASLDRYEGAPHLYRKAYLGIELGGSKEDALVYIMNSGRPGPPSDYYYRVIEQGYADNGIGDEPLRRAFQESAEAARRRD